MTLVVAVNGRESIWLAADRRLSRAGKPPQDDGNKVTLISTTDGKAILAYSGLGATVLGTQPADWMASVLRGRSGLSLEGALGVIAGAVQRQIPRHLVRIPRSIPAIHNVVATALVKNEVRLYTIDLELSPDRKQYRFRYTRHIMQRTIGTANPRAPRLAAAGSGSQYLLKNKRWMRRLLRVVNAADRGQISDQRVADAFAELNHEVHGHDSSVGPRCVVAWRHKEGGHHKMGGACSFYNGAALDRDETLVLPDIANGMDMQALAGLLMPRMLEYGKEQFLKAKAGIVDNDPPPKFVDDEELSRLPNKPDDKLR